MNITNSIINESKHLLYRLFRKPYNKYGVPLAIIKYLSNKKAITFLDIGASAGVFSEPIFKFYKIEKAILIEPIVSRIAPLKDKFHNIENLEIINVAVSDRTGEADFYISKDFDVLSSLLKINAAHSEPFKISPPEKTIVKTETLDNIVAKNSIDNIDLIKIDVQGVEHLVLIGGINTLKVTRFVFTEFSYKPMYNGSSTFFDIHKILSENNFRMTDISPAYKLQNGEIIQGDALFVNNALTK